MSAARRRLIDWVPEGPLGSADVILDRFTRWCTDAGIGLYAAQEEALLECFTDHHVVLNTPTGSGKSLVALGMHFKALCEGRRSFYTAPIKALVSEKFFSLCEELGPENVGMMTGDASINWAAPIVCCTAEVLANMALRQGTATDAPYVAMDEFHYFADRARGWAWQVPLLVLRKTRFLLMSATLGNTAPIEERLAKLSGRRVAHVFSDERPVPLDYTYRETPVVETVESLLAAGRQPIYMVHFTQREAAEQAQGLTGAQITDRDEKRALADAIGGFRFDSPYGKDIQRFLRFGIGLHHAGLLPKYRLLVEQLAQRGLLKVICGTDTLGVGVNIPIRTVLFTKLSKFDGEKVGILSVREFKQIAGRAGRKGFDTAGSIVCQAPEHVIENQRSAARAAGKGKAKKPEKKAPPRGFVGWTRETFEQLVERPPEMLRSQFAMSHAMLVALLQRGSDQSLPGSGYRELIALVEDSFETPVRKRRLRREAAVLFRSLRRAGIVQVEKAGRAGTGEVSRRRPAATARVDAALQRDFGLHHTLSLYLVDAVAALDPESPDYALDVVSIAESILENPRALLEAQVRARKTELVAEMKAERVPYEERMARLENVTWDKPIAPFLYSTLPLRGAASRGRQRRRPPQIERARALGGLPLLRRLRAALRHRATRGRAAALFEPGPYDARAQPAGIRPQRRGRRGDRLPARDAGAGRFEPGRGVGESRRSGPRGGAGARSRSRPGPAPPRPPELRRPGPCGDAPLPARARAGRFRGCCGLYRQPRRMGAFEDRRRVRTTLRGGRRAARRSRRAQIPLDAHRGADGARWRHALRRRPDPRRRRGRGRCADRGRGRARRGEDAGRNDAAAPGAAELGADAPSPVRRVSRARIKLRA